MTARKPGANYFRGSSVAERLKFHSRPDVSGCIVWTSSKSNGYGHVWDGERLRGAHRVSYELTKGPIPRGLQLDHLCCNRACINPDHLEPVTRSENVRRGETPRRVREFWASVTHCKYGHKFTVENTYIRRNGRRSCRACRRVGSRLV